MKRIIYTLLAATISLSACNKEHHMTTVPGGESASIADADFYGSKATIVSSNKKPSDNSLEIDYELVIKEVAPNKYKLKVKLKGIMAKGKAVAGKSMENAIFGVTTTIKGPKLEGIEQLNLALKSTGKNGDVFEFAEFEYKGDLDYELLDVSSSFRIKGGDVIFTGSSTISILQSTITVDNGNFKPGNDFNIKEGTTVTFNQEKMETNFAILFGSAENECQLVDKGSFLLLPKGHTVEQAPKVAKVTFPKSEDGSRVMRITVVGDPAENVSGVLYTPAPVQDPNNPDVWIQQAPIEFTESFSGKKTGWRCYDTCVAKQNNGYVVCGTTNHFKPADFSSFGDGWARIALISKL